MSAGLFPQRLSERVWKIVEEDKWGQFPFVYVIEGWDKLVVIDTGTGAHNIKALIDKYLNPRKKPYLVLLTHIHFDHVGGAKYFTNQEDCLGIWMVGVDLVFSQNVKVNSLAMAHGGAEVGEFQVDNYLKQGDLIYLDDNDMDNKSKQLEVILTPGHTPDSSAFYFAGDRRVFSGDTLYPYTAVHVDCLGSNETQFFHTIFTLTQFVKDREQADKHLMLPSDPTITYVDVEEETPVEAPAEAEPEDPIMVEAVTMFLALLGMDKKSAYGTFNPEGVLSICDMNPELAMQFYLQDMEGAKSMCPPKLSKKLMSDAKPKKVEYTFPTTRHDGLVFSCGHIESDMPATNVDTMLNLLGMIKSGSVEPMRVDGDYGEYNLENFNLLFPLKPKWNIED